MLPLCSDLYLVKTKIVSVAFIVLLMKQSGRKTCTVSAWRLLTENKQKNELFALYLKGKLNYSFMYFRLVVIE